MENFNVTNVLEQVDKVGDYISEKLQVPAEMAYQILMKQVWFEFACHVVWIVVGIILIAIGLFIHRRIVEWLNGSEISRSQYLEWQGVQWLFSVLGLFFGGSTIIINLHSVLQILINPEWYMIQMILEKVQ